MYVSSDVAPVLTASITTSYAQYFGLSLMTPSVVRSPRAYFPGSILHFQANATCTFLLLHLTFTMLLKSDFEARLMWLTRLSFLHLSLRKLRFSLVTMEHAVAVFPCPIALPPPLRIRIAHPLHHFLTSRHKAEQ